jgi:transcription initiation factor IIE alpha subunit
VFFDIYDRLKGISTDELRNTLRMSHQTLTSRLSDLQDEGLIKCVSQTVVNGMDYSVYMYINNLQYRKQLILYRKREKYLRWLKNAETYFEFMTPQAVIAISTEQELNCREYEN